MKKQKTPVRLDGWLTKNLSGNVFTWREIARMTGPYILDNMSIMLIGMLITALISKNGETSIAAISLAGPIVSMLSCVFSAVGAGSSVVVAQCCGAKDDVLLKRSIGQIIWLMALLAVIACFPLVLFPKELLLLLYPKAEAVVLQKAEIYLSGSAISIMAFSLYYAIFSILQGMGESKRCLALSVIINVAYFVFSILCLNILNLDVKGSILALISARVLGALCAVVLLFFWRPPIALKLRNIFSYDGSLMHSTIKISLPLGMEQIFNSCGAIVAGVYMVNLGTEAIAANATASSLLGGLTAAAVAAGSLSVTVVGRCIGAKEKEEAYHYGKCTMVISLGLLILTGFVFYPALPVLLKQYNPTPAISAMTTQVLLYSIPFLLLFWPASYTLPFTLRAAGDSAFPSTASLIIMWIVNIGLGYVLAIPCGLSLLGVWIAQWVSWIARSVVFYARFRGRNWLQKEVIKSK